MLEPLSLSEVKKHLELASTDTAHDVYLAGKIEAARMQFQDDTGQCFIERQVQIKLPAFREFVFSQRPVASIDSITFYDASNVSGTLYTEAYQFDAGNNALRLAYGMEWPDTADRWDAVTITYTVGKHLNASTVPAIAKSAMLLLVGFEFENRDDLMGANSIQNAYERLVLKYMRSTYP